MLPPALDIHHQKTARSCRPPQTRIPPERDARDRVRCFADQVVANQRLVGPLTLSQLHDYGRRVLELAGVENRYLDFATVLVNNALWRDRLAAVPFDRRLLLLPKCLRPSTTCRAKFDELGLLCERCGSCCLNELQEEAERLGYAVLIAEGSAVVLGILEARNISAIIGVSCLSVLEKSYSFMEAAAIPGAAVPLLHDDCCDTNVDLDWVWDTIYLSNDDRTRNLDLNRTRCQVRSWFEREKIDLMMGDGEDHTSGLARDWLTGPGKRWRPFLTACTYRALSDQPGDGGEPPEGVRKLAVAVECFHKASLIHDDIEDGDACRYGKPTLHAKHGIPVALNVGDLLIGEGYRLIAECGAPAEQVVQMGVLASEGHRTLCLGQGMELHWMSSNETAPPAPDEVIRVFAQKTAPAFEVALRLAAYHQGASQEIHNVLSRYSQLLGIAYQIRDDVSDWLGDDAPDDLDAQRPSLILAMTWEKSAGCDRQLLQRFCSGTEDAPTWQEVARLTERLGVVDECQRLLLSYKERAIRELQRIDNGDLRGLLRRVIGKIFNELECDDWQCEPEPTDGCGGATGKYAAR